MPHANLDSILRLQAALRALLRAAALRSDTQFILLSPLGVEALQHAQDTVQNGEDESKRFDVSEGFVSIKVMHPPARA